jgi:hypothetical protein
VLEVRDREFAKTCWHDDTLLKLPFLLQPMGLKTPDHVEIDIKCNEILNKTIAWIFKRIIFWGDPHQNQRTIASAPSMDMILERVVREV